MKRSVERLEFYITNVCNLSCPDCNRFNDRDFRGHQLWSDYERDYEQWAQKISSVHLVILGGEPLLNPSICDWIRGLNRCFQQTVQVLTNGTRLNKTPGLYESLIEHRQYGNWIGVSVHNRSDLPRYFDEVKKFLKGTVTEHHAKDCVEHTRYGDIQKDSFRFTDSNGLSVQLLVQDSFFPAAIQQRPPEQIDGTWVPGKLRPFDSDPEQAHEACGFARWKNYHMIHGKLHKCGPCVLLSEFDKQHALDITAQDRKIMNSYQALSAWDDDKTTHRFFKQLDRVIPQCKFCPTQADMTTRKIFAKLKKSGAIGSFG